MGADSWLDKHFYDVQDGCHNCIYGLRPCEGDDFYMECGCTKTRPNHGVEVHPAGTCIRYERDSD